MSATNAIEPQRGRPGRPYPTTTPLGRIMHELGLRVVDVAARSQVHPRTISDYLAGRRQLLPDHRARLADALSVPPGTLGPVRPLPSLGGARSATPRGPGLVVVRDDGGVPVRAPAPDLGNTGAGEGK